MCADTFVKHPREQEERTMKNNSATLITNEPAVAEEEVWEPAEELTEEELERLDREMEETYRTGATPLLDALVPAKDWHEEELLEIYRLEVERRLRLKSLVPAEGDEEDAFWLHVERSFKRGQPEAQCARDWLVRES